MPRKSQDAIIKVLRVLTYDLECSQYDLPSRVSRDYRTVLRHVKDLEKERLIQLLRREISLKHGKRKKIYGVTLRGLVVVLILDHGSWDRIGEIAEKHGNKLLVFEKWNYFAEKGLRDKVVSSFKFGLFARGKARLTLHLTYDRLGDSQTDEQFRDDIDATALGLPAFRIKERLGTSFDYLNEIWEACKRDKKLRAFCLNYLANLTESTRKELTELETATKFFL